MKPLWRKIGWVALAGAGLVLATAVATLDGVDARPYFRQPYYAETAARLRDAATSAVVTRGELAAGFGRASLTPPLAGGGDRGVSAVPLAGYGARQGRPATGVHDELEVKCVALRVGGRVVALLGMDLLIVPPEVAALVASRLARDHGLRREQIYFSATHTHAGPGGWGEGRVAESFAGKFQPAVRDWLAEQVAAAVAAALRDLRGARLGHGRFAAPAFVRNRLVGAFGRVDPEFSFLLVEQAGGRRGVLGSFAAHATVLPASVMEFSADYPGYWQRAVEAATGGVAVFLAGGVASHGPVAGEQGFAGAERMGRALAERLLAELPRTPLTGHVALGAAAVDVALPEHHVRVSDGVRLRPWLARQLLPATTSLIQGVRVNDVVWLSTPCDFSGELALGMKDALRQRGGDLVVTSFNGGYIGYVVPARYYHLPAYETRTMSFHGPNVPDYLDEVMRSLALALLAP